MNSTQQSPLKWRSAALLSVGALLIQLISPAFAAAKDRGRRDNLQNPMTNPHNPYVPLNRPAIGDLMDLFSFDGHGRR
jgi:hypothetical protein